MTSLSNEKDVLWSLWGYVCGDVCVCVCERETEREREKERECIWDYLGEMNPLEFHCKPELRISKMFK